MAENKADTTESETECTLTIAGGRLHVRLQGDKEAVPATIVYLRPLSARSEIVFFNDDSQEILSLESLDKLAAYSVAAGV